MRLLAVRCPLGTNYWTCAIDFGFGALIRICNEQMGTVEWRKVGEEKMKVTSKNFLKSAINPKHKGFCTPMSKATCTPRRKALAMRLKKGGDLYSGKK